MQWFVLGANPSEFERHPIPRAEKARTHARFAEFENRRDFQAIEFLKRRKREHLALFARQA